MSRWWVGTGGGAAVFAGFCWMAKAVLILVTGDQPALLYEMAFLFFPLAVVGLYASLPRDAGTRDRAAVAGVAVAAGAEVAAVGLSLAQAFGPATWEPRGDTVTLLTPLYVLAGLGSFVALFLVGLAVHRRRALPGRARSLPLLTAVGALPLLALGGLLGLVQERLVEVPVLLLGAAWMAIGLALGRRTAASGPQQA